MFIRWKAATVCLVCMLLGTGCGLIQQPQTYMRLPKLSAEEEKLMEQVQLSLPQGAAIIRPRKSNQVNTVPILDLNGDGNDEAVLFYKNKGDKDQIIGEIWTRVQEGWKRLTTLTGEGFELDMLKFVDFMQNGKPNVLIGYGSTNKGEQKGLTVYSLEPTGQLQKQFESPYQELVIDDLNQDGKMDMTVINRVRGKDKDTSNAVLFQYEGSYLKKGEAELDPYVNGYYSVISGNGAAGRRAIFLDASVGAHSSYTQILVWDAGRLKAVLSDSTFRAYSALSSDVDGDGIIEIPLMRATPGWENAAMAETPWVYPYYKWDGNSGLTFVLERYYNNALGYYIEIPKEWLSLYTLEKTEQSIRFLKTTDRALLAEFRFIPIEQYKSEQVSGWVELTRTATTVFVVNEAAEQVGRAAFHLVTDTPQLEEDIMP